MSDTTWTLAYRKPRANRFQRVTNWRGTWHQASELAGTFADVHPDLEVYYVPTADVERIDEADRGNILVESSRRARMFETGQLSAEMIALAPDASEAKARFDKRASRWA